MRWVRHVATQYRQCTYKRDIEVHSRNHCCRGKAMRYIFCVCASSLSLCSLSNIIRVMGWAGFVARMRTTKMCAEVWWGGLEGHLEDLGVDGIIILKCILNKCGRVAQSVKRLATGWTVRGSNSGGGEVFRTCPDRTWGPHSLLYIGYWVFPGGKKRPGRDADPSPLYNAVTKKGLSYTSTPPMGRIACTEPQCLYKGALYLS